MGSNFSKQSKKGKKSRRETHGKRTRRNISAPMPGRFPDIQPPPVTYRPGERALPPLPPPPSRRASSRANPSRVVSTTSSNGDPFYLDDRLAPTASPSFRRNNRDVRATEIIHIYMEQPWAQNTTTQPAVDNSQRTSPRRRASERGHSRARSPSRDSRRLTIWPGPNAPRARPSSSHDGGARSSLPSRARTTSQQRPSTSQASYADAEVFLRPDRYGGSSTTREDVRRRR